MLSLSKFPFKTLKSVPAGSDNRSTGLLLQAGYIRQEMAGAYIFLHHGMRVMHKIEQIVRVELDAIDATEIQMTALGSREHWLATDRWDHFPSLFKIQAGEGREYALNATHEEIVTPLMREFIQSYKDLSNMSVYQFQTKFRNEARAKSGILRGREFRMKDMYSFHTDEKQFQAYYELCKQTYVKIYERLGI
jgi:prolyl-tRNA synthetase